MITDIGLFIMCLGLFVSVVVQSKRLSILATRLLNLETLLDFEDRLDEIEAITKRDSNHVYQVVNRQENDVRQMEKLVKRHETALNYAIAKGLISSEVIEHEQEHGR